MIAVTDLDDAVAVYRDRLGITAAPPRVDDDRGVASVLLSPPSGGLIELLSVRDPSRPFAAAPTTCTGLNNEAAAVKYTADPPTTRSASPKGVSTVSSRRSERPRRQRLRPDRVRSARRIHRLDIDG